MHKRPMRYLALAFVAGLTGGTLLAAPLASRAPQDTKKEEKKEEKKKPEDKYTKFFKDKKVETAKGKFVTLHKIDEDIYLELPTKYLGKELMMGAVITSTTDPDYLAVGSMNSAPVIFRLEPQDSVLVLKTPNTLVYRRGASPELSEALKLNYRDLVLNSFKPEVYRPDSSAVVIKLNKLVKESNSLFEIMPKQQGPFKITSSRNAGLTFVRGLKSFDNNASVCVEMNFSVTASLLGIMTVAKDMPLTAEVTYTIMPAQESSAIPRFADARVGYETSRKVSFPDYLDQSEPVYLAHRWNLVPKDKSAYAAGKLSEPVKKIVFYLDNTLPAGWAKPVREGVLRWNKAFEGAGFKNVLEVRDFPKNDKDFDPDNLEYSCIRFVPNTAESVTSSSWTDPRTGEIFAANITIYNNVERQLYKDRFIATGAVDPSIRSGRLSQAQFEQSLSLLVSQEVGSVLGLLPNHASSYAYSVEDLRSSKSQSLGLASSILDGVSYNFLAQPTDKGARLVNDQLGPYDLFAIDWGYRYFPKTEGDPIAEAKLLTDFVNKKAGDARFRYAPVQRYAVDPTVREADLGNDPIKASDLALKNLAVIRNGLEQWVKDDPDSRKKTALYLAVAQQYYQQFKNGASLVGGIICSTPRLSSGQPSYRVVPKAKQREAFLWVLDQAKKFQGYANRNLERKGFMNIGYFDQILEFIVGDILNLRSRIILAAQIDKQSYSLEEYFEDLYQATFSSTIAGKSPNHMERLMQTAFIDKSIAGAKNPRNATPSFPIGFASPSFQHSFGQLSALDQPATDYAQALQSNKSAFRSGNPSASIYPMANIPALDTSDRYMYTYLVKLRPLLEQRAASTTDKVLRAHYQTLAFKVAKLLDEKK